MAKQLNISFKENQTETDLFNWVKAKLNPGTYIKELLYADYLAETNGIPKVKYQMQTQQQVEPEGLQEEPYINRDLDMDEMPEF